MSKNWTQKLRLLQRDQNVTVKVSGGTYEGREVVYRPRYETDRTPWLLKSVADSNLDSARARFNGRECRPVYPDKGES